MTKTQLPDIKPGPATVRAVPKAEKAKSITKGQGDAIQAKAEPKLGKPAEKPAPKSEAKAPPKPAPKAAAPKMSADDKAIGMDKARHIGGIKGHMTYR